MCADFVGIISHFDCAGACRLADGRLRQFEIWRTAYRQFDVAFQAVTAYGKCLLGGCPCGLVELQRRYRRRQARLKRTYRAGIVRRYGAIFIVCKALQCRKYPRFNKRAAVGVDVNVAGAVGVTRCAKTAARIFANLGYIREIA